MSRRTFLIAVYSSLITVIIIIGIWWRGYDHDVIRNLGYKTHSYPVMKHEYMESNEYLKLVRVRMAERGFEIIDEYQPQASVWELVGQSHRYWLLATHLNKMTVIDAVTKEPGDTSVSQRGYLVFEGFHTTGSKVFISIAFLILMLLTVISIRKEQLPSIKPFSSE